jgi:hypothetical protein
MKTQKKVMPILLGNPTDPKIYKIFIGFSNNRWAELKFNEKDMAMSEYNRIRSTGIYSGTWIKELILEELK